MNTEKLLLLSPSLAKTLGLEEALLLGLLQEILILQANTVIYFSEQQRNDLLPFWSPTQFAAILNRLQAQSVIKHQGQNPWMIELTNVLAESQPANINTRNFSATPVVSSNPIPVNPASSQMNNTQEKQINSPAQNTQALPVFTTMNEARLRNQYEDDLAYLKPEQQAARGQGIKSRRSKIQDDWEPSEEFPQLLSFHDIPLTFALSELAKFRQYYLATDRTEISWDVRFLNWVQRAWHDSLNSKGRNERQQQNTTSEPENNPREKRTRVRDALRNISDTDW